MGLPTAENGGGCFDNVSVVLAELLRGYLKLMASRINCQNTDAAMVGATTHFTQTAALQIDNLLPLCFGFPNQTKDEQRRECVHPDTSMNDGHGEAAKQCLI